MKKNETMQEDFEYMPNEVFVPIPDIRELGKAVIYINETNHPSGAWEIWTTFIDGEGKEVRHKSYKRIEGSK